MFYETVSLNSFVLLPLMKSGSITAALTHGKILHHNALTLDVSIINVSPKEMVVSVKG